MEFERVVRVLEERECLRFRREVNRFEGFLLSVKIF